MSYISHWLLLVSVIFANIQFNSDFVFGTFFYTPCILGLKVQCKQNGTAT